MSGAGRRHWRGHHNPHAKLAGVEIFYTGLLIAVGLFITWFAGYVVYRLLHEDK